MFYGSSPVRPEKSAYLRFMGLRKREGVPMKWILVLAVTGMVGCDRSSASGPVGGDTGTVPPSGLDTLLDLGRGLVEDPARWLPGALVLDPAMWQVSAIEVPVLDLLRPGRLDGSDYVVWDSASDRDFPAIPARSSSTSYRCDTSWASRTLSDTSLPLSERQRALTFLLIREVSVGGNSDYGKNWGGWSLRIVDSDGDGRLRSAGGKADPRVRFEKAQKSYFGLHVAVDKHVQAVIGAGPDGMFAGGDDNPLHELSYGYFNWNMIDTARFQAHDAIAGAVWNASNASGSLERRARDYVVDASVTLGASPSFRDLRATRRNAPDSFWTTAASDGIGTLNWVGGTGRTDTVRLELDGKDWFRLPAGARHGFFSRPMAGKRWSREDLDWTEAASGQSVFERTGTFRFRRWSRDGGGVWFEGIWSVDQWNQRSFVVRASGTL